MRTVQQAARVKRPPSTKEKLEALKNGAELPVDPATLYMIAEPGPDERSVLILARVYQKKEDPVKKLGCRRTPRRGTTPGLRSDTWRMA
jgi:hypothetical protein